MRGAECALCASRLATRCGTCAPTVCCSRVPLPLVPSSLSPLPARLGRLCSGPPRGSTSYDDHRAEPHHPFAAARSPRMITGRATHEVTPP